MSFEPTSRTTPTRYPDRVSYDQAAAYQVLDAELVCHLGRVQDGEPRVLPMLCVRVDDTLYLHGSTGSRTALALSHQDSPGAGTAAAGTAAVPARVVVTVTVLDALIFGRSHFHHSANYRSVVVHGTPRLVTDEAEQRRAMAALVDKTVTGRAGDSLPATAKQLAATAVLALPLVEVSVKSRAGGPVDDPVDLTAPYWAGTVPVTRGLGAPRPDDGVTVPVPAYLRPVGSPWQRPVPLHGQHVRLEPLDLCHASDLFAALDDEEVHRHQLRSRPRQARDTATFIDSLLDEARRGARVAWVQRDAVTGTIIGTTSYMPADETNRLVHIGTTLLGRPWWRTGVNTESKLLLMTRAFDDLGAVRVEWQTDARNTRSQAAIERLGATREGVLRRHRRRDDGTWRDTMLYSMTDAEWPQARNRLVTRLARG